ncbi:hypothetical protein NGB36_07715 [Streptomyces sp. RB6PN25]|uniref:Uncharacterized protein n=1 Tax=Streptomyces humicola TaxID=2953240 RepID=A0ABT1PS39_9ACTN|nr:hypothetical protein [Streptomyces humicola]MCQ4080491.1 hypothetical protein [Streptomyces humicola]
MSDVLTARPPYCRIVGTCALIGTPAGHEGLRTAPHRTAPHLTAPHRTSPHLTAPHPHGRAVR